MVVGHDRSNRFEPHKVGFINFWVYKNEVYPFYNGNILFRGQNGQGKSVSMQSIIPLLLDGNTHPSRIDPFGAGKRKIGDYLKVDDAVDKSRIAYLYLTYKKLKSNEVVTTGIGLRSIDESKNDFWGFVIKGKEIGMEFPLTKPIGYDKDGLEEYVPLSKDELKTQIERMKCGKFVTSQKEYAEEVNKQVFQFENVDLFKELTKLLIQIRSPKLSKEMKPDVLYEALKKSLGEVPSSDFSMISNTIKDIDDHNRKLKTTLDSLVLSSSLLDTYEHYREAMLGNAASRYLKAFNEHQEMMGKKEVNEKRLITQKADLINATERLEEIVIAISTKQSKLGMLETSQIRSLRDEHQNKVEEKQRKEDNYQKKEKQLSNTEEKRSKIKQELDVSQTKSDAIEKDIKEILVELQELTSEIQFYEGEAYLSMAKETLENPKKEKAFFDTWYSRLKSHTQCLKDVLLAIEEEERIYGLLNEKKNQLREINSEIEQVEKDLVKLEKEFDSIKSTYKAAFGEWVKENEEMILSQAVIGEVMDVIENLYDFGDMNPKAVEQILYDQKEKLLEPLKDEVFQNRAQISVLTEKINTLAVEQKRLETEKEVLPPFRRVETINNRKTLENNQIPFVPFYEAVEFLDGLTEEQKERVESSLLDMGLLDSLIVPNAFVSYVKENDSVILPKELPSDSKTLLSVLKSVVPENSTITEADITAVLKSIPFEETEHDIYVTTTGDYRNGILKGNAVTQRQASFIGKEARRRHREQKIAEIKEQINLIKVQIKELETGNILLEQRKTQLVTEFENRPIFEGLDENREQKGIKGLMHTDLQEKKQKLSDALEDLSDSYHKARVQKIQVSEFLEGPKDKETVEELFNLSEKDYFKHIHNAEKKFINFEHMKTQYENACEHFEEVEQTLLDLKGELNVLKSDIEILKKNIEALNEMLKKAGADKQEEQIKTLRREIQNLTKEEKEKIASNPLLEQKIEKTEETIRKAEEELVFLRKQLNIQEEIFGLELKTNQIIFEENLLEVAKTYEKETDVQETQKQLDHAVVDFKSKDMEGYLPSSQEVSSGTIIIQKEDFPGKEDRINIINSERKRLNVTLFVNGIKKNPREFHDYLKELEEQQRSFLKKDEETLIKNVMIQGIGEKIKDLIAKAIEWKDDINALMKSLNNSIELRLLWEPIDKNDKNVEDHLTTTHLVKILSRDFATLMDKDVEALSKHFMSKINLAKERLDRKNTKKEENVENLEQALKQVLDYRDWYKFKIMYTLKGEKEKVLDEKNLNILSGGEKAMAIYIPLFSAAYSKYNTSSPDAPYMIALDEAFAGVDEDNISEMFSLMEQLGFNYILTSQALWADYPSVSGINIYELSYDKVEKFVFSEPWRWDGKKLDINEEVLFDKGVLLR